MTRAIFLAALFAATAPQALAWEQLTDGAGMTSAWDTTNVTLNVDPRTWADWESRYGIVLATWEFNKNPSRFQLTVQEDDDSWYDIDNGENELAFTYDMNLLDGAPGVTWNQYDGNGTIVESDVFMDWSDGDFTTSTYKLDLMEYGGDGRPVIGILLHEFGHVAGLAHEGDVYNVMGIEWKHVHTNGSTVRSYLGEDASTGLRSLYGDDPYTTSNDVAVSHWRYLWEAVGGYSNHERCRILDSSGADTVFEFGSPEPAYWLRKGTAYRPEVQVENNGDATQVVTLNWYLSTDANVNASDTRIGGIWATIAPDAPSLYAPSLTIPSGTASGYYYLGVVLDRNDNLKENNETNNAVYIAMVYIS